MRLTDTETGLAIAAPIEGILLEALTEEQMARIIIAYGTTEGHTRKIAEFVAGVVYELGHQPELIDTATPPIFEEFEDVGAFILAGSLHQTKHQHSLLEFVREYRPQIRWRPSLFLSVSLTAVIKDEKHKGEAMKCVEQFIEDCGLQPTRIELVAGALKYTEYDFLKRMLMRMIASSQGGDTDTSKDYEYTDWSLLRDQVTSFLSESVPTIEAESAAASR